VEVGMSESLTIELHNRQQARDALQAQVFPFLGNALQAGVRLVLSVKPQKRNLAQNARLHARLTEIADRHEWAGSKRDPEVWKRLLTAAWLRARGESVEILPALDGHGVDVVFRRTSDLTKAECGELMEFIDAWEANL
jgi:hypothetical protein